MMNDNPSCGPMRESILKFDSTARDFSVFLNRHNIQCSPQTPPPLINSTAFHHKMEPELILIVLGWNTAHRETGDWGDTEVHINIHDNDKAWRCAMWADKKCMLWTKATWFFVHVMNKSDMIFQKHRTGEVSHCDQWSWIIAQSSCKNLHTLIERWEDILVHDAIIFNTHDIWYPWK